MATARTFGGRFLDALREHETPMSGFNYATIQELKQADRDETIRILRREVGNFPYHLIQQFKRLEPEEVAKSIAQQHREMGQQTTLLMMFMLM